MSLSISPNNNTSTSNNNNNNETTTTKMAETTTVADNEKTNLIVNYLPQDMKDEQFEDLFKKFGEMKSCKIVRNRSTGYSYGFGFVDFKTHEQALKAIDELNGLELETKKIKVAFARPAGQDIKQANLYIKNIPSHWTQDDVRKLFEPYGNIIQIRVLGDNRGIAFVLYDLRKQAEDAREALKGTTVEGNEAPLEIKFAADKKVEKGGNKNNKNNNNNNSNNNNNNNNSNSNNSHGSRRGHRGGRNHNRDRDSKGRHNSNQRSFFDRRDDRGGRGGGQYNAVPYAGGNQYGNYNSMNGIGPVRHQNSARMNRYTPFVQVQQQQQPQQQQQQQQQPTMAPPNGAIAAPMAPSPAYGFPAQQSMIPYMLPTQQMMPMNTTVPMTHHQAAQPMSLGAAPMNPYQTVTATAPVSAPIGYSQMAPNAMQHIYNVASNTMNNAANMQPQLGQPMNMNRPINNNNHSSGGGGGHSNDDGVTLFVYNIGSDSDDSELRSMFSPYGHVVKCNVVRKTPGGETKGFGFVTMKDRDQASAAISGLNGSMRNGRALQVSLKK